MAVSGVGKVGRATIIPPEQLPLDADPAELVTTSLQPGSATERYRRIWRVGGTAVQAGVLFARLGYSRTHSETVWDPELQDFDEVDVLGGVAAPFAVRLRDLALVFQVRSPDIRVQSFVGALRALLQDATALEGWHLELPQREASFVTWRSTVTRVTRLRVRLEPPNPNYQGRPSVQALIEGARLGSATLDLRSEDLDTDADIVLELLDHVERGYGEATAVGEVETDSGEVETVYNSALGGATELKETSADVETGEVDRETLVSELTDDNPRDD